MLAPGRTRIGQGRVLRGGSWINNGRNLRSAYRNHDTPDNRNHNIGLRLAGASPTAGGSTSQCPSPLRPPLVGGQTPGPRRGSRPGVEPLPLGRLSLARLPPPSPGRGGGALPGGRRAP